MKKRIISALLLICIVFSCIQVSAAAETAEVREFPSYYNSYRDDCLIDWYNQGFEGKQDQLSTSACWAFVQNELIVASLARKTGVIYDFSEETMKFETSYLTNEKWGYYRTPNEGGNEFISTAYLARTGSVLESDEPFTESEIRTADPDTLARHGYLDSTLFFQNEPYNPNDKSLSYAELLLQKENKQKQILKVKELITDYGAVGTGLFYEATQYYENPQKTCYNYTGTAGKPNHSVTIIGWDDNYSADNFKRTPEANGAFLVKNSWGSYHSEGRSCYVWVSYYDKFITSQFFATDYEIENNIYDNVYQYDGMGWTQNGLVKNDTVLCISKFNAEKMSEKLSAVSFYTANDGMTAEILVNVSGDMYDKNAYVPVSKEYYETAGYYFVDFEPITLLRSEYYVAVRLTGEGESVEYAIHGRVSNFSDNAVNVPDTCFVGTDFSNITPLEKVYRKGEPMHCIKAFTKSTPDNTLPSGKVFSDVQQNKWYYDEVEYCVSHGIFSGMSKDLFQPDTPMSRAMFITVLANLSGEKIEKSAHPFTDVADGKWYTDEIAWGYKNGIVSGISQTAFEPDTNITREQMCFMMLKFCEYKGILPKEINEQKTFTDADMIRSYAKDAVSVFQRAGIISGMTDGSFAPRNNATRAEVATVITILAKNYIY